jgi:hypothetical protein
MAVSRFTDEPQAISTRSEAEQFCRAAYRAIHHAPYRAQTSDDIDGDTPPTREEFPWSEEVGHWMIELDSCGFTVVAPTVFIFSEDHAHLRQLQIEGKA